MTLMPNLAYCITCQIIIKKFETVCFLFFLENTNINNGDFYYVGLRQQTLSLGSVDLRQQNKSFKNYCNPSLSSQIMATPLQPCRP